MEKPADLKPREILGWTAHEDRARQDLLRKPTVECPFRIGTWEQHEWLTGWARRDKLTGMPYKKVCLLREKP